MSNKCCYIAISPDGQQIVTFDPEGSKFTIYDIEDFSKPISTFPYDDIVYDEQRCYSLAISNRISNKSERLLVFPNHDGDKNNSIELGDKIKNQSRTWVISTTKKSEIHTCLESIGGVIRFLDSDVKISESQSLINKTVIIIVNVSGIYKQTLNNDEIISIAKIERFELPQQLSNSLSRISRLSHHSRRSPLYHGQSLSCLDHGQNALELLHTSIIKNHFIVHSFKNQQQIIEMYNLITGDLEMLFKRHEPSAAPNIIRGSPIFAISQNEDILAFCRGTISITLYLMENGLEITTKQLGGIDKILAMYFIDNDKKLLIALEEKQENSLDEISIQQIFVVWDLFTTFKDSIRQINYSDASLKMDATRRLINSHGKILVVNDNKNIISVLENQDVASILNPPSKKMKEVEIKKDDVSHAIYDIDGGRRDASELTENRIIRNVEPWNSKKYSRLSFWLDSTKKTQLIISPNTVQVWKYCNIKNDQVLEYIWASNNVGATGLEVLKALQLRVRKREFVLNLLIPSTKSDKPKSMVIIHWPNDTNVLEGACRTLYVLGEKKHIVAGHKNTQRFEYLIECTQRLVRKYITKYGIFRLTDIRYPIMKYLIKGHQESLIKQILNTKINGKNSNIHIPRLYKRNMQRSNEKISEDLVIQTLETLPELKLKSKSDLQNAILYTQRRIDSTAILKYLIDYYADNAKEYNNDSWMFTVSKAIPLLYDHGLSKLFKKPCFGITEAYTPPLHINPYDQKKGNSATVIHSLAVKPCLALPPPKFNNLWILLKKLFIRIEPSRNDRKVYIVPLPDFTIYPNPKGLEDHSENYSKYFWFLFRIIFWPRINVINDTKHMSPFLRVIHEEKGSEIYQTPTIMAVLEFKWAAARPYFIRHIFTYILYAISYTVIVISYSKGESRIIKSLKPDSPTLLTFFFCVYGYTGWYLIVTEIVQLKREGLYRYINIYNIFDCASVVLPLICVFYNHQELILQLFNPVLAFTALVMWFELTIRPFLAFMLIVILAFGHAMFILLDRVDDDNLVVSTYKINDTSNPGIYSNITIYQNVDKSSRLDNYYSDFLSSIVAVFYWTNGRWDQLSQWDSFAVIAMSIMGSIILLLIFQNMLIAFMNGAFDKAYKADHTEAYRYRVDLIAEYEALEKPFDNKRDNPRYIYYIPDPDVVDTWLTEKDENQKLCKNLAESTDSDYSDDCDDDFDDDCDSGDSDQGNNSSHSKKDKQIQNDIQNDDDSKKDKHVQNIIFFDEEIFGLKLTSSKSNKKSLQKRLNAMENEFKTRFDALEKNFKTLLDNQ
ncbi:hypothetical protein Glove_707g26 [Diversispora epigaea]|uniref:Ion transport domain-containing protein n=1 Tax=Diversispora epigaea TaxID=1348612 RepID=A0A397G7K8_9GLOM|nr:hypothetical protein Glove_707g26 [Diversispora epigaea]